MTSKTTREHSTNHAVCHLGRLLTLCRQHCLTSENTSVDGAGSLLEYEDATIGGNDTDFCLSLKDKGYKILQTPYTVLFHLESQSRLADRTHPADTKRFMDRYESFIKSGDPYYSPYLENEGFTHLPKPGAESPTKIPSRLVTMPWAPSKQLQKKGAA